MMTRTLFALLIGVTLAMFALPGCASGSRRTPREEPPTWTGPAFRAAIEVMESQPPQYAVRYETTVPTGGWTMVTDDITLAGGVVTLKITLVKPGRDEIVTQALETLRDRYLPGRADVRAVTILARLHERGATPPDDYAPAFTTRR